MKMKRKVQMNERELIKYLVDHESTNIYPSGISIYGAWISIEPEIETKVDFEIKEVCTDGRLFTVEVEEEITEDTVLPKLVTKNINGGYNGWTDRSIDSFIIGYMEAIYIPNDDLTMTLIWRDGKLVE